VTTFGLKLMSELRSARTLLAHASGAEEHGFEYVAISDHFHPWLPEHDHSPFAWSVLGAVAAQHPGLELATGVTCPIGRYHPAVVAQAAATVATLSDRPFTLAVGSGERLNEHVTGAPFPAIDLRQAMLREAIEIIRALWTGRWTTIRGRHFTVEDARIYDLPEQPLRLVVAVSGPDSITLADEVGADGVMATTPERDLVAGWVKSGGDPAATWTEVACAWTPDAEDGRRVAHERFRFGVPGWKVMSELPNPVNFDAACATVTVEDVAKAVPSGPDPQAYVEAIGRYVDAGFERIAVVPVGDDLGGFLRAWTDEIRPRLPG
jgi:G6PDH family F420-dependent oxidoreductase